MNEREQEWIGSFGRLFGTGQLTDNIVGIGDDAAVLVPNTAGRNHTGIVVSVDSQVLDVHYRTGWLTEYELGRRLFSVSFSDIAAMGARPWSALLSLEVGPDISDSHRDNFSAGLADICSESDVRLVGGNIASRSSGFSAHLVAIGLVTEGSPLLRSGAQPGDPV